MATAREDGLVKGLGLVSATTLVMGSMIGSGVFIVAADISRQVQSPGLMIMTWIVTSVLTLTAALSYGELAAAMPHAGGQYVYLREAFGPLWGFLRPKADFEVETRKKHTFTSAKSEARYDTLVHLITQVDPAAAGKAYRALQPYCQSAYAEIAPKGKSFDDLFRKGLQVLIETPTVNRQEELVLKGAMYRFKDPALEGLPPAQKLLIRTGPANQRSLQSWLKAFAKACE